MISATNVTRAMELESVYHKRLAGNPFLKGVVYGIHLCIEIVRKEHARVKHYEEHGRWVWTPSRVKKNLLGVIRLLHLGNRKAAVQLINKIIAAGEAKRE